MHNNVKEKVLRISGISKTYRPNFEALREINLDISKGEIFALLGPNGAGKTTLISVVCGLVTPTAGSVNVKGHDIIRDYRAARELIGLVPQELTSDAFETVWNTVSFSRGLYGKPPAPDHIESILKALSLWEKKDNPLRTLSGGMKRRVLIAKALSHEPEILFLDEPTAGVDVELRQGMWEVVRQLRDTGVTIILTTHYIEEAEEMADRVGVINKGELVLVEEKSVLMQQLGEKRMSLELREPINEIPQLLAPYNLELADDGHCLIYTYDTKARHTGITDLLHDLHLAGIMFKDLNTQQSTLEEIFVKLVRKTA